MARRSLVGALLLILASCAYVEATSVQYVGVPRPAPVKPADVQVLPGEPAQRHDRLGEVLLTISSDVAPPAPDFYAKLRVEGAKMGANAVYVIGDVARRGEDRKLIGIAIRFK